MVGIIGNLGTIKTMIDKTSEQHRHQCEVRYLLRKRKELGRLWLVNQLIVIEKHRKNIDLLKKDIRYQWLMGNRGMNEGEWYDY